MHETHSQQKVQGGVSQEITGKEDEKKCSLDLTPHISIHARFSMLSPHFTFSRRLFSELLLPNSPMTNPVLVC